MEENYRVKGKIKAGDLVIEVNEVVRCLNPDAAKVIVLGKVYSKVKSTVHWKEVKVSKNE